MADSDHGLFGPDSVTWQVHSDPVMWIAGVRALYLQALHPRAVRGVTQNSDFQQDAWGRLLRTAAFVGCITYGTSAEAERAGARVRGLHRRLWATDPTTGERYRVDEPALLLWVHCAEVDSYLHVARRSGVPLSDEQADRYLDEQRAAARLVGLEPAQVPRSTAELYAYFRAVRPGLAATPESAAVNAFLRRPPVPPPLIPARGLLWSQAAAVAYGTLPPFGHKLYSRYAPAPGVVTKRLTRAAKALRAIPPEARWKLPPGHIVKAVARLGPDARPSLERLRQLS
ncbi:oxygenase MpaB family protein [Streptomyces sp. ACA25]|uniref:oxygenase MpaB family protein n=1 Tax=Streptomyces sp. ACA25 TaxID=3022596 RepID=UPI0023072F91|nr:oxygenase MpaB family protein [Streptomyces sp. ACA25]MDB1090091.1 oxygenase MpaB family protein [Streptomyces sp. ACA25]